MKIISKLLILMTLFLFLAGGTALAFPYIEVEGFVDPVHGTVVDNGNGTTTFDDVLYTFLVTDAAGGAEMNSVSLEFENDVFQSIGSLEFVSPTNWTANLISSSGSLYELTTGGTTRGQGQSLIFTVDLVVRNEALTDPLLWQEGSVWGQSWFATDTLGGGDGGSTSPVPEPATMLLLGSGLIGMAGFGRRKFFKKR